MHLMKIEPQSNQYRFYRMEIVPGLFGDWGLVREWGRIGGGGRVRTDWFNSEEDANDARLELCMQKAKRGYDQGTWHLLRKPARNAGVVQQGLAQASY